MKNRMTIVALALWAALLAVVAIGAGPADNNAFMGFGIDVTGTAQGFTIASMTPADPAAASQSPPFPPSHCTAWLVENDSTTETAWVDWSNAGGRSQPPVAVADPGDTVPNQMRLKPGQAKTLSGFSNTYVSVISTGAAHLHFECHGSF